MSLEDVQYKGVTRFLFMKDKSRDAVIVELKSVYADESPSRATIYRWFNYFQSGRTFIFVGKSPEKLIEID